MTQRWLASHQYWSGAATRRPSGDASDPPLAAAGSRSSGSTRSHPRTLAEGGGDPAAHIGRASVVRPRTGHNGRARGGAKHAAGAEFWARGQRPIGGKFGQREIRPADKPVGGHGPTVAAGSLLRRGGRTDETTRRLLPGLWAAPPRVLGLCDLPAPPRTNKYPRGWRRAKRPSALPSKSPSQPAP